MHNIHGPKSHQTWITTKWTTATQIVMLVQANGCQQSLIPTNCMSKLFMPNNGIVLSSWMPHKWMPQKWYQRDKWIANKWMPTNVMPTNGFANKWIPTNVCPNIHAKQLLISQLHTMPRIKFSLSQYMDAIQM